MDRKAWSFALVSVAVSARLDGRHARDVRIVLGGVAPVLGLALVAEIASITFIAARDATLPRLVPLGSLPAANAISMASGYGGMPIGSGLFALTSWGAGRLGVSAIGLSLFLASAMLFIATLLVGRVPLTAPPCTGDGVGDVTPNPCKTTVQHTELVPDYMPGTCTAVSTNGVLRTIPVEAIRFRNHAMTVTIVDPTYPGDAMCRHDRGGSRLGIPTVYPGFAFGFHLIAGFATQTAGGLLTVFPSRVVRSPDGVVWIVDEGDIQPTDGAQLNTRGQLIRVDPDALGAGTFIR
jgi:hypothetical protein